MANSERLLTYKIKRNEAKKRKLEAFLNLVRQDLAEPLPSKKKPSNSFTESYNALKKDLRKYNNQKSPDPVFIFEEDGRRSIVNLAMNNQKSNCTEPLFIEDIHHLLFRSVLGNLSPYPLCWAKLQNARNVNKTVFLEIERLSQSDISEMQSKFNKNQNVFPFVIEILSSDIPFASDLSTLHLPIYDCNQIKKGYSSMFPVVETKSDREKEKSHSQNNVSKLHLLLSPIQLVMEHYPLPHSVFEQSKSEGYSFSKEKYSPVSELSPMFAVDCEMCRTVSGRLEVTRIAVVNENLETVYHTLVKPKEEIINYLTKLSGITEKMLQNVTTTLEDVQNNIRRILPNDAILCGQSLNFDLHALRMIHPYVIDTSVIYNEYGVRQRKTSLKQLARIYLKESIQDSKKGHNPIEDSIATMKLVQLKLENFIEYGNTVLLENSEDMNEIEKIDAQSPAVELRKPSDEFKSYSNSGFFSMILKFSKKVCLIGSENYLSNYPDEVKANTSVIVKSKLKKIINSLTDSVHDHDLILSHLILEKESYSSADLSNDIIQLYNSFPERTVFIIFMPSVISATEEIFKKNYCMITVKTDKPL